MKITQHPLFVWAGFALLLVGAPLVFPQAGALSLLSQMGTMMLFALSYNILLGQGGMLSFGHAVYAGLGAFFAVHAMNWFKDSFGQCPVSLIPLVGGVAGMVCGVVFGYVTTKKSGTTFAMITLGIVELVGACSLMFPGFFGGEGGVSTNRVIGEARMGISFGPQIEVYYLIAVYLFICTLAMYLFTQTPLGRILNAVRDNPERVEFLGYDSQWVRYLGLIISSFFAGIAGGLGAINFEIVSAENVSAVRSGAVLLFTFIGGVAYFYGPILGAILGVLLSVVLSNYTHAWLLYLGLFFILMVLYAPGGIASLCVLSYRLLVSGLWRRIWAALLAQIASGLTAFCGVVMVIEMLYQRSLESSNGSAMSIIGIAFDSANSLPWVLAAGLLLLGLASFIVGKPRLQHAWQQALHGQGAQSNVTAVLKGSLR